MSRSDPVLSVRNLRLSSPRSGRTLVEIDALDLYPGEILGMVGPSGAGKSLTALSLMGLVREHGINVDDGEIRFRGVDMLSADDRILDRLRGKRIAMAFQEPLSALDPVRRCRSQLLEPLRSVPSLGAVAREAMISDGLERAGLRPSRRLLDGFPRRDLSGGERQRLLMALATLLGPEILIADEPSTQLDPILRVDLTAFLRRMRDEQTMASIVISHDEGLVSSVADRIVYLRDGRIVPRPPSRRNPHARPSPVPAQPHAGVLLRGEGLFKVHGRGAGRFAALDGVDISLGRGEVLGLMGASGAGKSTLARCLAGLDRPDRGSIEIELPSGARARHRHVQMIYQDPGASLDPLMPVGDIVAEGFGGVRIDPAEARAEIERLLAKMGLPAAYYDHRPGELSGGQRQRVAIARAMAAKPAILIADEPTTALDRDATDQVVEALVMLREQRPDMACIIVSHDLRLLERLCTRLMILDAGRVVEEGAAGDVLAAPRSDAGRRLIEASRTMSPGLA